MHAYDPPGRCCTVPEVVPAAGLCMPGGCNGTGEDMSILRDIRSLLQRTTCRILGVDPDAGKMRIQTPSHNVIIDDHVHESVSGIPKPDFTEMARVLLFQRDYSAEKMQTDPEDLELVAVSFVFVHKEKPGILRRKSSGQHIAFATGDVYKDAEARELVGILDTIREDVED